MGSAPEADPLLVIHAHSEPSSFRVNLARFIERATALFQISLTVSAVEFRM